jgi:flagellum-specific peptidoglycan hydrolase FlgJ
MVSQQHEAGCCPSVESLTGVWATDPTYGRQILSIYQSILDFALTQR